MRKWVILLCLLIPSIVFGRMTFLQLGGRFVDWSSVTVFLNFEGTWDDDGDNPGTYTLAASELATDTTADEGAVEGMDINATAKKIGSYGQFSTESQNDLIFDATGDLDKDEGIIGFWFQVPTAWDDATVFMLIQHDANNYIRLHLETDGTNEITFRYYSTGDNCGATTDTTMSTGTWYFVELAWKVSTDLLYIWISTDSARGDVEALDAGCSDMTGMDAEPGVGDFLIGQMEYGEADLYIDNVIAASDSTKNLWELRNETSHP